MKVPLGVIILSIVLVTGSTDFILGCATHLVHAQTNPELWKNEIYVTLKTKKTPKHVTHDMAYTGA